MAFKKLKYWYDTELAKMLATKIKAVYPTFEEKKFVAAIKNGVDDLELKDRVEFFADALKAGLPAKYPKAIKILLKILGPENEEETGMFKKYYWVMPIAKFVEKYGLEDFDISMNAIAEITKRNTGEYCIRPYLVKYPKETLAVMNTWAVDENFHLRRLASEGVRIRLPWAKKMEQFVDNPKPILKIIEKLKDDKSKFVQKSVANSLNDLLKDNYDIAIKTLQKWSEKPTTERKWVIKHALRNERKKESADALKIMKAIE